MYKLRQLQTMAKRKLHGLEICKCLGVIILAMPEIKLSNICKTGKMEKKTTTRLSSEILSRFFAEYPKQNYKEKVCLTL